MIRHLEIENKQYKNLQNIIFDNVIMAGCLLVFRRHPGVLMVFFAVSFIGYKMTAPTPEKTVVGYR